MPVYVNPQTGERFENVPEAEQARARSEFGLVPAEQYEKDQAYEKLPLGEKVGDTAKAGFFGLARGVNQLAAPVQSAVGDEPAPDEKAALQEKLYGAEGKGLKERHPIASGVGEAIPIAAGGAALGTAGVGLKSGLALLGGESALSGISQEAIDATMEKRDFSAKSALWNGVLDMTFGALAFGAGKVVGRIGAVDEAVPGVPGRRNFLAEIDKGAVPEPRGTRPARSAGAADEAPTISQKSKEMFLNPETEAAAIDDFKTIMGGALDSAEPGAAQNAFDAFDEISSNATKHADFVAAAPKDAATRAALDAERAAFANQVASVGNVLGDYGAKGQRATLHQFAEEIKAAPLENVASLMDQAKQKLDKLHMSAVRDKNNVLQSKEILSVLDPAVERARATLMNPKYVGPRIAELQEGRNRGWVDFLRNIKVAEKQGVKLFTDIEPDYITGKMVIRYNPAAMDGLLALDAHRAKPVMNAWAAVFDSMERIAQNTAESGADSAARAPLQQLTESLEGMRTVMDGVQTRLTVKRMGEQGAAGMVERAGRMAEDLPLVGGAVKGLRKAGVVQGFEAAAKSRLAVPVPISSSAAARQRLHAAGIGPPQAGPPGQGMKWTQTAPGESVDEYVSRMRKPSGGAVAGVAGLVGGGALLASGEAGAAELPHKRAARSQFEAELAALPPEAQAEHIASAEAMARVAGQTEARVRASIGELFHGTKQRFRSPRQRQLEQRAIELDVARPVARFMGPKTDDPVEAWQEKRKMLTDVMADPSRLVRAMSENLGQLPQNNPQVFMRMVSETMATLEYLHALAPQPSGKSVLDPEGYPPSLEEITSWAGHWVGALHPLDTLDDLAANDLVPEQMDAVKARHPDAFQLFQQTALSEIGRIRKSKRRIPMHQLEAIDSALDLDGAAEPTLSWDMARLIQMGEQQAAQTGQQPPQMSPMQSKGSERVASSAMASIRPEAGAS